MLAGRSVRVDSDGRNEVLDRLYTDFFRAQRVGGQDCQMRCEDKGRAGRETGAAVGALVTLHTPRVWILDRRTGLVLRAEVMSDVDGFDDLTAFWTAVKGMCGPLSRVLSNSWLSLKQPPRDLRDVR